MSSKKTRRKLAFGPRRGYYLEINAQNSRAGISDEWVKMFDDYDMLYRSLCGILFNFVPKSGHPGGSISSGRIVEGLLFSAMNYRIGDPDCPEADILSYAAGHKAMGLYAMWALRNECCRISRPRMLPGPEQQLRLEDMLGFRRNPTQETPLFKKYKAKPLDGHPTPLTPFVKLSTGASGVGVPTSFGLAIGAMDTYGKDAPFVHVLEGEGGMTPGRVSEALATAATAQMWNVMLHVDWNQASIDSDRVCREGEVPGEYVQWNPVDFCYLHDWNVILVEDGKNIRQVLSAQRYALDNVNGQPTAIVYRTVKGWQYGIEGRTSHGAGHDFCSDDFCETLDPAEARFGIEFPRFCGEKTPPEIEACFFEHLLILRSALEKHGELPAFFGKRLAEADRRLTKLARGKREGAPDVSAAYADSVTPEAIPDSCRYAPGSQQTLRAALGQALNHLNHKTGGAFLVAAADLLGSTSIDVTGKGFPQGYYNAVSNPGSRLLSIGGICEDAMAGIMAGLSTFGSHIGAGSSYGAFIAALSHIAARLHGIGQQAKHEYNGRPYNPWIIVCAHAGLKTGEDGPTHADPQALQLLEHNFPRGVMITLTPWDPQEVYPTLVAALKRRPALVAPFVTRPGETVFDRAALGLPPATAAAAGLYALRSADRSQKPYHGTLVLQGSGVTNTFIEEVLPRIDEAGYNMNIFYVSSAELFDLLPDDRQQAIFPETLALEAMGITGFTLPTMMRWVVSAAGRRRTLHAFRKGHYLGSGQAHKVLEEAGLHGEGQWQAVREYAEEMSRR